jgi:5-methylthioadenosine/S-adenosylhomocysteine deaminase
VVTDEPVDLVIRGGTVVPMERATGSGSPATSSSTRGGSLEVVEGATDRVRARVELDASGAAVLPGFIQCHVHVVQSLLRHQADGLTLLDWLNRRTLPYEAALDGDGVATSAKLGIAELLTGGTTTVLDFGTTHDHDRVFEGRPRSRDPDASRDGRTWTSGSDTPPSALLEEARQSLTDAEEIGLRWHGAAGGRLGYAVAPRFALSCSR